ncbi:MAG: TVP38/TMEM64 family protein [Candidatus Tectomicrobia bacterium]|nr:TVP38/TMEM64 family protein [Candidatus Tectomicrobia bacterium]
MSGKSRAITKFAILVMALLFTFLIVRYTSFGHYTTKEYLLVTFTALKGNRSAPPLFILLYAVGCVVAIPGSILTIVAGGIFGTLWGGIYTVMASNLGAGLAFFMAKLLGREFVESFTRGRLKAFDEEAAKHGLRVIFTLRLIPLFPFNAINFGAGLSGIRYRDFLIGSIFGMLPGTFIYTYFADSLINGDPASSQKAILHTILSASLLILLSLVPMFYKKLKNRLTTDPKSF